MDWTSDGARNRFSELVTKAINEEGPQRVTCHDDVVIVLSEADSLRLRGKEPNCIESLLSAPDLSELELTHDRSPMRQVDL